MFTFRNSMQLSSVVVATATVAILLFAVALAAPMVEPNFVQNSAGDDFESGPATDDEERAATAELHVALERIAALKSKSGGRQLQQPADETWWKRPGAADKRTKNGRRYDSYGVAGRFGRSVGAFRP